LMGLIMRLGGVYETRGDSASPTWVAMGLDSSARMGLATSASASKIRFIGLLHSFGRTSAELLPV
ncbi:hypothetical protein, partial [Stutzerimonas stutzeri]|uniref:hypothetical protein n=1 Tax=Stutzerimonas stutzeri TaxID=316 RepID=UPI0020B3C2D9